MLFLIKYKHYDSIILTLSKQNIRLEPSDQRYLLDRMDWNYKPELCTVGNYMALMIEKDYSQ